MNFLTRKLLKTEEINLLLANLNKNNSFWEEGKKTAGSHASKVKNNLQLSKTSAISLKYSDKNTSDKSNCAYCHSS